MGTWKRLSWTSSGNSIGTEITNRQRSDRVCHERHHEHSAVPLNSDFHGFIAQNEIRLHGSRSIVLR
jgi:hypothetical protein